MPRLAPKRFLPPPSTLGAKLGGVFLIFAGLLAAVCAIVIFNLGRVGLDARKFMEENREALLSDRLLGEVGTLETLAQLPPTPDRHRLLHQTLEEARRDLDRIYQPGREHDPSRPEHQAEENRIDTDLQRSFDDLEAHLDATSADLRRPIDAIRGQAGRLEEETRREASLATGDLDRRIQGLVRVVLLCSLASAAVLLLAFALVQRDVLDPVRRLQQGTELFAQGSLDHRIEAGSRDEIGELARAFNRMAESLAHNRRELEEQVQERTRQFLRAAKLADLGTLAAGVAHEVNTPLASIASAAEGMERRLRAGEAGREDCLEYLRIISREAYRAHDITARLLALARNDPGPVQPLRIEEHVADAVEVVRHAAERRRVKVEPEVEPGLPDVAANGPELEQVFLNLLKNAVDASPDGGTVRIACRLGEPGEVLVEVTDQGSGIAAEHLPRLFDPFFTTKAPGEGTGLGLSLAHRIVESHGGRIEAGEAPGGGARFTVTLPAAAAEPEP
jgi:signal transduction histidine kinase